jgi:hypothetical protein
MDFFDFDDPTDRQLLRTENAIHILDEHLGPEQVSWMVSRFLEPKHCELNLKVSNLTKEIVESSLWHRAQYGVLNKIRVMSVQGVSREILAKARAAGLEILVSAGMDCFVPVKFRLPSQRRKCVYCNSRKPCLCRKVRLRHHLERDYYSSLCWNYY